MDVHILDPVFPKHGQVSLLCDVQAFDEEQQSHLLRTALKGRRVVFRGSLPAGATVVLLIQVQVTVHDSALPVLSMTSESRVCAKPHLIKQNALKVVEVCVPHGMPWFRP